MSDEDVVVRITGQDAGGKKLVDDLTAAIDKNAASAKKHAAALKETSDAGEKAASTADKAKGSFEGFSRGLELITTALAAEKLLEFAKSGLEAQLQIARLADDTGASTESISILGLATQETGGRTDDLAQAFRGLSRSQAEVQQGNAKITEAYHAIGLSVSDLAGLKPDELFKKVADAQAKYSDGLGKSAALQQIFGRNAQELLPVLNAIAGEGLAQVTQRAQELGIVLDQETAEKAKKLSTQLTDLKAASTGVAEQITEKLVPGLTDLASSATNAVADLPDKVKSSIDYVVAFTGAVSAAAVAVKLLGGIVTLAFANPVTIAIVALAGLATVLGVVYEHEKQAQQAQVDHVKTYGDQTAQAKALTAEYEKEVAVLAKTKDGSAQNTVEKEKLKKITDDLKKLGPEYATALGDEAAKHDDVTAALKKENEAREKNLELAAKQLSLALAQAQADLDQANKDIKSHLPTFAPTSEGIANAQDAALAEASDRQQAAQARVNALTPQLSAALAGIVGGDSNSTGTKPPVPALPDTAALQARLAAAVAAIKEQIRQIADAAKAEEQANTATYAQGLESLTEYYDARRTIIEKETGDEITKLQAEQKILAEAPAVTPAEAISKASALNAVGAQIDQKRKELATQLQGLDEQQRQDAIKLTTDIANTNAKIFEAAGFPVEAAKEQIADIVRQIGEILAKIPGLSPDVAAKIKASFETNLTNANVFAGLKRDADQTFAAIANQKAVLDAQLASGNLGQQAHDDAVTALERVNLPTLQKIGAAMEAIAHAANNGVGNPQLIAQADAFTASIAQLGIKTDLAAQAWANFKDNVENALEGDLVNFLGSSIDQVHGLGDAFRQLALSAVQSIQQILAQLLVLEGIKLAKKTLGIGEDVAGAAATTAAAATASAALATGGTAAGTALAAGGIAAGTALDVSAGALSASGGILLAAASALTVAAAALASAEAAGAFLGFAGGGVVSGPGGPTGDRIPAMLSDGEGILNARTVQRITPAMVHQLNRGAPIISLRDFSHLRMPHFASGGIAGEDRTASGLLSALGTAPGASFSGTIGLEDGLLWKHLDTPKGARFMLQFIARNAKKIKAAIGAS